MKVSVCGLGVVGSAVYKCFSKKGIHTIGYDKYKYKNDVNANEHKNDVNANEHKNDVNANEHKNDVNANKKEDMLSTEIVFLCLPTPYKEELKEYDKSSIEEVCSFFIENEYKGLIVLKSTVEPGTTRKYSKKLNIVHNPEFLTASTAEQDFENQNHIVIGSEREDCKNSLILETFYKTYWGNEIKYSKCTWEESELMKLGVNCFYATKIQFFNELYQLALSFGSNYEKITKMMINNGWISDNHIKVPGPDGQFSYGGMCFPKDTNALLQTMKKQKTVHSVLEATIQERNEMRKK
jgi:UDPglucose 6-dehydrogenase